MKHYTAHLESAAENFLISAFDIPTSLINSDVAVVLIDAAMHIVSRSPWGSSEPSQVGWVTITDEGDGTDIQPPPDPE